MSLCWYCSHDGQAVQAVAVVHDRRKCVHVCQRHAEWRETTSKAGGHKDCPDGQPDGPGPNPGHGDAGDLEVTGARLERARVAFDTYARAVWGGKAARFESKPDWVQENWAQIADTALRPQGQTEAARTAAEKWLESREPPPARADLGGDGIRRSRHLARRRPRRAHAREQLRLEAQPVPGEAVEEPEEPREVGNPSELGALARNEAVDERAGDRGEERPGDLHAP